MDMPAAKTGYGMRCSRQAKPRWDEADALFMIGACAAFVSYLLNKARTNGSFVRGKLVACYVLLVD